MTKPICRFLGCGRAFWSRGYCSRHYYELLNSGLLPRKVNRKRRTLIELFHASYVVNPTTQCWEWVKWFHRKGYAYIQTHDQKKVKASRFAYEYFVGTLEDSDMVLHSCDNPKCVNPDHFFKGDAVMNMLDCMAKGRATQHLDAFKSKLSDANTLNIRIMFARGEHSMQNLADIYFVDQQTIKNLLHARTYQAS
jgi:hypothetical protein